MKIKEIEAALSSAKKQVVSLNAAKRLILRTEESIPLVFEAFGHDDRPVALGVSERTMGMEEIQSLADFIFNMFGIRAKEAGER